ncbi:carnitine O-acetyltransferase [Wickerhamomyces ciferrii]|uniref:Carnitine O-acetyltransferase n=1 Tax=Wickerhamomyces ciferrii (strain ATCC 14091 / BCRC 22168 / CBS 111 / JCM 3599 / NBRC 0793 / NRRL Y-1031 F-60-10) TaxID=1206466 RepID=K0KYJ0_WICCF|nr:carnitine O-acetyltransferase [Wickerhamomyces ciferrii]CCH47142.1 carnitine O-acetyltransferase [Wickerhamomyces ciferrii]
MSTFDYQDKLEKLPIPDLKSTCENYLSVLKPLQTEQEHKETIKATESFLKGIGPYLDDQLRKYANSRNSYIEQFWFDSYLNSDSPVVLNLNPFFLLEDDPTPINNTQIKRASSLTQSSLEFIRALRREELPPDMVRGVPLSMDQYHKLFGSSRIPTKTGCIMQTDSNSHHIVVMSKSQFYWFDVLDKNNDLILTDDEISINFESILKDSQKSTPSELARSSFGVLTTENRKNWANLRNNLINDEINYKILKIIDSALFMVILDDLNLETLNDLSMNMLCGISKLDKGVQVGTCTNRWYDKLQLIITKNAKAGINFEHTGVDGHTVLRFCSDIYTDSILKFAKSINSNSPSIWKTKSPLLKNQNSIDTNVITIPRKLEWNLTSDLSLALRFAETRISDLISQYEFACLEFKNYGSDFIKKLKCSPDAFVQMSFQAAYYVLYGKVECTYEPAMTKQFFHGRTESIRTVSLESNQFVRRFFEDSKNLEKLDLLQKACSKHSKTTKNCSNGQGQDRHLYALFNIWKRYVADQDQDDESSNDNGHNSDDDNSDVTIGNDSDPVLEKLNKNEIPSIFADSGWDKINNSIISTSNCGNPALKNFGFGPTSSNGFGIAYIIKSNSITVCVSSKHRQTQRFIDTLKNYYEEISHIYNEEFLKPKIDQSSRGRSTPRSGNLNYLLGGYGYFDLEDDEIKSRGNSPERFGFKKAGFTSRQLSEKLRLAEY